VGALFTSTPFAGDARHKVVVWYEGTGDGLIWWGHQKHGDVKHHLDPRSAHYDWACAKQIPISQQEVHAP
jgi:trehalose utilization protein